MRASFQRNVSEIAITELEQLPSFRGGWSKWTYSSNGFCSCCRLLFWKSRSFVYWTKLIKIPFCVVRLDLPITQMCSWNESKHVTIVQRCRPRLSLAMEETTRWHSHTKTTVKSSNATRTRFVALFDKIAPDRVSNDTISQSYTVSICPLCCSWFGY